MLNAGSSSLKKITLVALKTEDAPYIYHDYYLSYSGILSILMFEIQIFEETRIKNKDDVTQFLSILAASSSIH